MKKLTPEKTFVYLALIFGILFVFLTPPFQSPDEDSHFKKAYLVSKGKLYPTRKNGITGNSYPIQMHNYINEKLEYIGDRDKKYSFSEMHNEQYDIMDYHRNKFYSYSTSNVIPIVYVAPAFGIVFSKFVAKVFYMENISTAYMLYFARIFSLLFTVFITYFAIKKTPVMKKMMVCIGLIPMTLFLSSVITYDSLITSISLLALSIILGLIYDKNVFFNWKNILILGLIGVILFNVKKLYFLIFTLMIFIPKEKYGSRKDILKKIVLLLSIIFILNFLLNLPFRFLPTSSEPVSFVSEQISFILHNPFKYANILWMNILNQRTFQLTSMIGIFGLIDTYLPISFVAFELFFLLTIALVEGSYDKIKIANKVKLVSLLVVIMGITIIYTAMYVYWTPSVLENSVGGNSISGVQGRYFLPLFFPFILIFSNKLIKKNKLFDIIENNYLIIPTITLMISVFSLIFRYWA